MGRHRHVCECVFEGGARLGYNWVRLQWDVIGVDEMRWDEGAWYDAAKIFFRASPILKISLFIWAWIGGVNAPLSNCACIFWIAQRSHMWQAREPSSSRFTLPKASRS